VDFVLSDLVESILVARVVSSEEVEETDVAFVGTLNASAVDDCLSMSTLAAALVAGVGNEDSDAAKQLLSRFIYWKFKILELTEMKQQCVEILFWNGIENKRKHIRVEVRKKFAAAKLKD
jgi:hypothetical protein